MSKDRIPYFVVEAIKHALNEDVGSGDITTGLTIDPLSISSAYAIAKEDLILAGVPFFIKVFELVDSSISVFPIEQEGSLVKKGTDILTVEGKTASILTGERLALNIVQRLSGIATLTHRFKEAVTGLPVKIVDTRKTTPNMRYMEKYAVRIGGGANHRFGLYDGVLIKDNHIKAAGSIALAVSKLNAVPLLTKVEVEVGTLEDVKAALDEKVDVIMLDNMSLDMMKEAVALIRKTGKGVLVEASGNVRLENVRQIAETGVDIISIGYLTHSAVAADISLKIR